SLYRAAGRGRKPKTDRNKQSTGDDERSRTESITQWPGDDTQAEEQQGGQRKEQRRAAPTHTKFLDQGRQKNAETVGQAECYEKDDEAKPRCQPGASA